MPDASFDIVIVGTEISGLALGALCARHGYTVLIIGHDSKPASYTLNRIPMLREMPRLYGFSSSPAIRSLFRDIGLIAEMRNKPIQVEPPMQVVTPGHRFDLSTDSENLFKELRREFGTDAAEMERFWRHASGLNNDLGEALTQLPMLPERRFFRRRKLARQLERDESLHGAEERLSFPGYLKFSGALSSVLLGLTSLHAEPLSALSIRRLMQHFSRGLYDFPGGLDGFRRLLVDRIQNNSGQFWPERRVESISVKRNRVKEMTIQRPQRSLQARAIICNVAPRTLFDLVSPEEQNEAFHGHLKALTPSYYRYIVNFALKRKAIPQPMGRNLVVIPYPKQELVGANGVWVHVSHLPDDTDDTAVLTVQTRIPFRGMPTDVAGFDKLNQEIQHSLEWVLPFMSKNLVAVDTPYVERNADTGEERPAPSAFREIYAEAHPNTLKLSPVPGTTAYKNVLILGEHYLSGLGLEGQFIAARQAFEWVQENVVLKQILRN